MVDAYGARGLPGLPEVLDPGWPLLDGAAASAGGLGGWFLDHARGCRRDAEWVRENCVLLG